MTVKGDSGGGIRKRRVGHEPTDGQVLKWDATAVEWIPSDEAGGGTDDDAIHDNVAAEISVLTEKASPVSGDHLLIEDSAAANVKKRVQVGNLPAGGSSDVSVFQVATDEELTTSSSYQDFSSWLSPSLTSSDVSWSSGVATIQSSGEYLVTTSANGQQGSSSTPTLMTLRLRLMLDTGSGYAEAAIAYDVGELDDTLHDFITAAIPSFGLSLTATDTLKIQAQDEGDESLTASARLTIVRLT